jgi:hypothetical protein
MPSHRNAIDTALTVNADVQNASPAHVRTLFAMKRADASSCKRQGDRSSFLSQDLL